MVLEEGESGAKGQSHLSVSFSSGVLQPWPLKCLLPWWFFDALMFPLAFLAIIGRYCVTWVCLPQLEEEVPILFLFSH